MTETTYYILLSLTQSLHGYGIMQRVQELSNGTVEIAPGLWQMTGLEFITHFLFETPFVLLRVGLYALPILVALLAVFFVLRYYWKYRKVSKEQTG